MTMGTSNDALATIAGLKQRIEWLEESIGRLLVRSPQFSYFPSLHQTVSDQSFNVQLEKEQNAEAAKAPARDNCCVVFSDASPDLERAITQGSGSNCCVTFKSSKLDAHREQKKIRRVVASTFLVVMILFFGAIFIGSFSKEKPNLNLEAETTALKLD
jgi:hypothetical protein